MGIHFLSDILCGAAIGTLMVLAKSSRLSMTALPPGFDPKTTAAGEAIAIGGTEPSASADGNESQAPDASGKNTPPHDLKGRTMREL
jgi:hypothetical protein